MPFSRRHFLLSSLALPAFAAKPVERPNVLLFLVDNLPAWMLGCYGNPQVHTPNLDRLSQTGTRFSNHFVCSPAPALSRATLLTGRTPMQLGDAEDPAPETGMLDKLAAGLGYVTGAVDTAGAVKFLDQQSAGKPFFLRVGHAGINPPYKAAQKFRDMYAQSKFDQLDLARQAAPNARAGKEMLGDIIGNLRNVAAAVTALDDEAAAILVRLSAKGLLDNTAVIFTSTCGSLFGRHGLWNSGQASEPVNMYDEVMATPMVWSWLGRVPAQAVRPEMVSAYDLVPTVCNMLSAPLPGRNLCGRSYLPLVTGKSLPKKQRWPLTVFGHYRNTEMAREDNYKLVLRDGGKGPSELYDLTKDRTERVNQYATPEYMTVRDTLAQRLSAWKQRYSR